MENEFIYDDDRNELIVNNSIIKLNEDEIKRVEKIKEIVNEFKFGDKIDLDQIKSDKDANKTINNTMNNFPKVEENKLSDASNNYIHNLSERDKYNALSLTNGLILDHIEINIPNTRYNCEKNGIEIPKDSIIHDYLQKCMSEYVETNDLEIKTPYKKLPIKDKLLNKFYKLTNNKNFNQQVENIEQSDMVLGGKLGVGLNFFGGQNLQEKFSDNNSTSNDDLNNKLSQTSNTGKINNNNNETNTSLSSKTTTNVKVAHKNNDANYSSRGDYVKELCNISPEEFGTKVKNDAVTFSELLKNKEAELNKSTRNFVEIYLQNKLHDDLKKTLQDKLNNHLHLQTLKMKARHKLAQNGTMSNEEIRQENPKHGVVKIDKLIAQRNNNER